MFSLPLSLECVIFLDWNAASVLTNIPCDWNVFFIATPEANLLNLSLIVFLTALLINQNATRITPLSKLGVPGFLFINLFFAIWFISFNFSDFNSLLKIFSSSTGNEAYQSWQFFIFSAGDPRYLWKGFVNLSLITFLATVALNLYISKRVKQQGAQMKN